MQKTIALSIAEAEYYSASEIAAEIIYLRNLIRNLGLPPEDNTPVYDDNTACIERGNHIMRASHARGTGIETRRFQTLGMSWPNGQGIGLAIV